MLNKITLIGYFCFFNAILDFVRYVSIEIYEIVFTLSTGLIDTIFEEDVISFDKLLFVPVI